jgi:hypothetical protein
MWTVINLIILQQIYLLYVMVIVMMLRFCEGAAPWVTNPGDFDPVNSNPSRDSLPGGRLTYSVSVVVNQWGGLSYRKVWTHLWLLSVWEAKDSPRSQSTRRRQTLTKISWERLRKINVVVECSKNILCKSTPLSTPAFLFYLKIGLYMRYSRDVNEFQFQCDVPGDIGCVLF